MSSSLKVKSNAISFEGIETAIRLGIDIDQAVIFLGTYGIGKSQGIRQAADKLGYCMVDYRAGEILPEDVGGIGVPRQAEMTDGTIEQIVERAVPDIVTAVRSKVNATGMPCILFLDEITSAVPAVQATLFQVLLDRMAGGRDFPERTFVVAAGNLITDRSLVEELARPLLNRASVYLYTGPTADEYGAFMVEKEFHPIVRTFLKVNEAYICGKIDPDAEQSPTPRSLEAASKALSSPQMQRSFRLTALAAKVGGPCAYEMEAFIDLHDTLTPVNLILSDPENVQMPDPENFAATFMQVSAFADAVNKRISETRNKDAEKELIGTAWAYARRYPVEMGCVFIASLKVNAVTALLSNHLTDLQSMHDGAYLKLFPKVAEATK